MITAVFESASIILREGLEAILVLAALAAWLTRTGSNEKIRPLYSGAAAALLASLALAWVFATFNNGMHDDGIEGGVMLLAAGLMLDVRGWLFLNEDPKRWQAYLKAETDKATRAGSALAIATLAFLAVFREGAETVLFLTALAKTKGGWNVHLVSGVVGGFAGLGLLWFMIMRTSRRLPLRPLFLVTSAFLFVMALKFIGEAFQEFQEMTIVGYHPAPFAKALESLGLNATWEAVGVQIAIIALSAVAALWALRNAGEEIRQD